MLAVIGLHINHIRISEQAVAHSLFSVGCSTMATIMLLSLLTMKEIQKYLWELTAWMQPGRHL